MWFNRKKIILLGLISLFISERCLADIFSYTWAGTTEFQNPRAVAYNVSTSNDKVSLVQSVTDNYILPQYITIPVSHYGQGGWETDTDADTSPGSYMYDNSSNSLWFFFNNPRSSGANDATDLYFYGYNVDTSQWDKYDFADIGAYMDYSSNPQTYYTQKFSEKKYSKIVFVAQITGIPNDSNPELQSSTSLLLKYNLESDKTLINQLSVIIRWHHWSVSDWLGNVYDKWDIWVEDLKAYGYRMENNAGYYISDENSQAYYNAGNWNSFSSNNTIPSSTQIIYRTQSNASFPFDWAEENSQSVNGTAIQSQPNSYIRWKGELSTTYPKNNPSIQSVSISKTDVTPPTIDDQQADDIWRKENTGVYDVNFNDASLLYDFKVKAFNLGGTAVTDWAIVVSDINNNSYTTNWQLPQSFWNSLADGIYNIHVQVQDTAAPYRNTAEENVFKIKKDVTAPSVDVLTPIGGESINNAESFQVVWYASDNCSLPANSITIYYSVNSGSSWTQIATDLPNSGKYSTTLPVNSANCRIKVECVDSAGNIGSDFSSNDFTIQPNITSNYKKINWVLKEFNENASNTSISYNVAQGYRIGFYSNGDLKFAKWNGTSWLVETVDSQDNVGQHPSLYVFSSDSPGIAYYDFTNGKLKYAKNTGSGWSNETIGNAGNGGLSLTNYAGRPGITYDYNGLKMAALNNYGVWELSLVDSSIGTGYGVSTKEINFNLYISYYDSTLKTLKYAKGNPNGYSIQTLENVSVSPQIVSGHTSIELDSNQLPHISYVNNTSSPNKVKYIYQTLESNWVSQTIGNGDWPSIDINYEDNYPSISYYGNVNGDLNYAKWTGGEWVTETVDSQGDVGNYSSIIIDNTILSSHFAVPHISYSGNGKLKYATLQLQNVITSQHGPASLNYASASNQNVTISELLETDTNAQIALNNKPSGTDAVGTYIYDIAPNGTTFEGATLTIKYSDSEVVNIAENTLNIYQYDEQSHAWVPLTLVERNTTDNWVKAQLDHASLYALLGEIPKEFVCTIKQSGGDYSSLSQWQDKVHCNLANFAGTRVFSHTGISGSIPDGVTVTGQASGATGQVCHVTTNQALIKNISGVFQNGENVSYQGNYITLSDAGSSAIAVAKIDGNWTTADSTCTLDGWTTSEQNYVRIYTSTGTTGARHNGRWDTNKYRISVNTDWQFCIRIDEIDHLKIDGLQMENTVSSATQVIQAIRDFSPGTNQTYSREISNCIIRYRGGTPPAAWSHTAILPTDSIYSGKFKIWNNIMTGWADTIQIYAMTSGATFYIYNNTINQNSNVSGYGIYCNSNWSKSVSLHLKNNIIKRNTGGAECYHIDNYYVMTGVYNNNISNDVTSPNSSFRNLIPIFTSTNSFHLVSTDTSAVNAGIDLSEDSQLAFSTDIEGEARPAGAGWDIGADEMSDFTAPANITDLTAGIGNVADEAILSWTAPGDDDLTGSLQSDSRYKIQYSTWTGVTWSTATAQITISTSNVNPGDKQNWKVAGLTQGVTNYFRIWTTDEVLNCSGMSNAAVYCVPPVEFVCTIKQSGGDFSSLATWNSTVKCNLTASGTKVFYHSTGSNGGLAAGNAVTGQASGATGTVVFVTSTQILLKNISGTFTSGESIKHNSDSHAVTINSVGFSAVATAKIDGSWTSADGSTIIDGWTTSAQNYVRIYTTPEARHSGVWNTNKYRISVNTDWQFCIRVDGTDHLKIDGLQLENTVTYPSQVIQAVRDMSPGASQSYSREISNCIIRYTGGTPPAAWSHTAIMPADSTYSGKFKVWNNIISGWCDSIQIYGMTSGSTFYIYNNTISGNSSVSGYGIYCNSNYGKSVSLHLKNNIIKRNTAGSTCYSLAYIMTGVYDNNISNDATSPNTNYRNLSAAFVSASNFHLVNTDTSAVNAGIDLSGDSQLAFTTDIDGNTRPFGGAWDIGADEYGDFVAPSAITNLYAYTGASMGTINLTWTAPGDDGTVGNIVNGKWRIDYSTDANYQFQTPNYKLEISTSCSPLTLHSLLIANLTQETTYYFRIWTIDESDNISGLSNGATAWADCPGGYGMFAFVGPDSMFRLGKVYSYPNPAKNRINPIIHAELGVADKVELKIFNIAAELVHSRDISDKLKIVNNKYAYEYPWEIRDIASGVYIYYIKADKFGEKPIKVIKKLGLIR